MRKTLSGCLMALACLAQLPMFVFGFWLVFFKWDMGLVKGLLLWVFIVEPVFGLLTFAVLASLAFWIDPKKETIEATATAHRHERF